jgi:serine/threonine protein phosphatase 1
MDARTIAVGDIHGCARALATLLAAIAPQPDDQLVILGDYIDRGPDTRGVLEQLLALGEQCQLVVLLGNHEQMLLQCLASTTLRTQWLQYGGRETVDSYGGSLEALPPTHLEFLRGSRRCYETRQHFFVHANYVSTLPLDQQPELVVLWMHLTRHLPGPHVSGKTAIVGHTPLATGEILDLGYLVDIDTCCFGGGWLTALEVETKQIWQANDAGVLRRRGGEV